MTEELSYAGELAAFAHEPRGGPPALDGGRMARTYGATREEVRLLQLGKEDREMKTIGSVTLIAPMLAVLLSLAGATNVMADPVPDVLDLGTSGVANDGTLIGNTSLSTDAALGNGALR